MTDEAQSKAVMKSKSGPGRGAPTPRPHNPEAESGRRPLRRGRRDSAPAFPYHRRLPHHADGEPKCPIPKSSTCRPASRRWNSPSCRPRLPFGQRRSPCRKPRPRCEIFWPGALTRCRRNTAQKANILSQALKGFRFLQQIEPRFVARFIASCFSRERRPPPPLAHHRIHQRIVRAIKLGQARNLAQQLLFHAVEMAQMPVDTLAARVVGPHPAPPVQPPPRGRQPEGKRRKGGGRGPSLDHVHVRTPPKAG